VGVDVFLDWDGEDGQRNAQYLGDLVASLANGDGLELHSMTNRGSHVWPDVSSDTYCTDHWRCRFLVRDGGNITHEHVLKLLGRMQKTGLDFIKTENLYNFDDQPGYSAGGEQ